MGFVRPPTAPGGGYRRLEMSQGGVSLNKKLVASKQHQNVAKLEKLLTSRVRTYSSMATRPLKKWNFPVEFTICSRFGMIGLESALGLL